MVGVSVIQQLTSLSHTAFSYFIAEMIQFNSEKQRSFNDQKNSATRKEKYTSNAQPHQVQIPPMNRQRYSYEDS